MASNPHFDTAVTVNICINIVAMAAVYYNTPRTYDVALALVNVGCTCGFAVEAWLKIVALGWRKYLRVGDAERLRVLGQGRQPSVPVSVSLSTSDLQEETFRG